MSSVDNRVVKMTFDNEQFERGVSKSMSTLDKLEEKLQFKNSAKGLSNLQNSINDINFNRFTDAIEGINNKLSATGVMAATVVSRITNSLIDGAMQIERATIGQIKSGGWNRAMNIENAKFSIEGLKEDWDELYKAMDYAVTGTAYGIDQAATAAASLVASGVDYLQVVEKSGDTNVTAMHKALRAISGVAAQTNSDFQSISRIFTTVAGQGRLMGDQLNQLAARGMNAAAKLGEALGMTEADVRAAVSAGAIDFETFAFAMDDAFGEHATDANKTFTGALSNMKAALSRFGAVFATPVIQKTNTFFIALTDRIKEMKNAISDVKANGEVLEEHLESHFAQMWEELITLADTLAHKIDLTWFWDIADAADTATVKIRDLLSMLNEVFGKEAETIDDVAKKTYDLSSITSEELKMAQDVIQGNYGTGAKRVKALADAAKDLGLDPVKIQEYVNVVAGYGYSFEKAGIEVKELADEEEELSESGRQHQKLVSNFTVAFHNFGNAAQRVRNILSTVFWEMSNASITKVFEYSITQLSYFLRYLSFDFASFTSHLEKNIDVLEPARDVFLGFCDIFTNFDDAIRNIVYDLKDLAFASLRQLVDSGELYFVLIDIADIMDDIKAIIRNMTFSIGRFVKSVLTALLNVLSPSKLTGILSNFTYGLRGLSEKFLLTEEGAEKLTDILTGLFSIIQDVVTTIGSFVSNIFLAVGGMKETEDEAKKSHGIFEVIVTILDLAITVVAKFIHILSTIPSLMGKISDALSENEGVKRLKNAIETLKDTIGSVIDEGLSPFKEAIGAIEGADPSEVTINKIAEAIGWLADKIAIIVEKIPEAIAKIEEFWDVVKEKATEAWNWIDDKIDFDSLKTKVINAFDPNSGEDIATKIKEFFSSLSKKITEYLENVDWQSVKTDSITLGILGVLWSMVKLGDASTMLVKSVKSIPDAISGIFKGFKLLLTSVSSMTKNIGIAAVIAAIAAAVLAIASAIVLLSEIPEDKFDRASETVSTIVAVISIIALSVAGVAKAVAKIKVAETAELVKLQIIKAFIQTASTAIFVVALAGAIKLIVDAVKSIYEMLTNQKFDILKFGIALGIVAGIFVLLLVATHIITKQIKKLIKKMQNMNVGIGKTAAMTRSLGLMLIGYGVVMAGLGAAVWFMADAIAKLSTNKISVGAILGVLALTAALVLAITWMVQNMSNTLRGFKATDILAVAGIIFVFVLGIVAILGVVLFMSVIATGASFLGKETIIEIMLAEIIALVLALGYAVGNILKTASSITTKASEKLFAAFVVIAAVAGAMIAIGYAVKLMCDGLKELPSTTIGGKIKGPLDAMLLAILLFGRAIMNIIKALDKAYVEDTELFSLALMIGAMGLMVILVAKAFEIIANTVSSMDEGKISMSMLMLVGIMSVVIIGMAAFIALSALLGSSAPATILAIGVSVALMATAILIAAGALWVLSKTNLTDKQLSVMNTILKAMGIMLLVLAVGAFIGKKDADFGLTMLAMATALVIASASLLVFAAACYIMQGIDTGLIIGVAVALGIFIAAIAGATYLLGNTNDAGGILKGIAIALLSIGGSVLLAAVGMLLMGTAITNLTKILPLFAISLGAMFDVLEDHKLLAAGFLVALIVAMLIMASVLKAIAPILNPILQTIATFLQNVMVLLGQGAEKIGTLVGKAITSLHQNATPKVKLLVVGVIGSLLSALTESGPKILQTIGKLLIMVMDWLSDAIGPLVDKLIVLLIELIESLRKAIQNHSNAIAAAIFNLLYALAGIVIAVLNQIGRMLIGAFIGDTAYDSTFGKFFANLQQTARERADMNMEMSKAMDSFASGESNAYEDWIKNMRDVSKEMKKDETESYLSKIEDKLSGSSIPKSLSQLKEQFGDMYDAYDIKAEKIDPSSLPSQAIEDMIKKGVGDFDENGDFYRFTAIAKTDVAGAESAYAGANIQMPEIDMENMVDMMSQAGYDGGMAFDDAQAIGIYDGQTEVLAATDNNSGAQIQAIKDTYGELHKVGKGQTTAQAGGIEDGYMDMYHAGNKTLAGFKLPWNNFSGASRMVTGSGANVGYNAVMSIYNGMEEGMDALPEGMKAMFKQAFNETEDEVLGPEEWNMHSPSKTTERWGNLIVAGLTNGIYENTPNAISSMTELSNSMISSFTNPLDYVSRVASGELTYDPSIRPVLDTSNIATGAYGIRSMFDNQNVSLSGFSGKLAADITGLDTTNTQVVSELKALRTEMNVMTDKITGMQIIMDSGQLVGAIAPGMDDALGRRAVHRGRGN